jgi:hypothetical protein
MIDPCGTGILPVQAGRLPYIFLQFTQDCYMNFMAMSRTLRRQSPCRELEHEKTKFRQSFLQVFYTSFMLTSSQGARVMGALLEM